MNIDNTSTHDADGALVRATGSQEWGTDTRARQIAAQYAAEWNERASRRADSGDHAGWLDAEDQSEVWTARANGITVEALRAEQDAVALISDRDAALDSGDTAAAERLTAQARQAIHDAAAQGADAAFLFRELDHPLGAAGGADHRSGGDRGAGDLVPDRRAPVREIGDTVARLRGLIGRDGDPGERTAALADKAALLAEIAPADDTAHDSTPRDGEQPGGAGRVVATFDPADAYSNAEIATIAAAHTRGDHAEVARLEAGRPSLTPERPADATTARGRDDSAGGAGGPGEGRDDPEVVVWWAPVDPAEHTLTRAEVEAELTHRGMTANQARAAVAAYLADTSRAIGVSVHQWGMDSHDVDAITHAHREPDTSAAPSATARAVAVPAVQVPTPRAAPVDDDTRREQLARWHSDDQTAAEHVDDAPERTRPVPADSQGW